MSSMTRWMLMPSPTQITVPQLSRLIGLPHAPALVDVRTPDEFRAAPGVIPCARRRDPDAIESWLGEYAGRAVVVYCDNGQKHSEGAAAWMREAAVDAQVLEGGFEEWRRAGEPRLDASKLPQPDASGRTVWVTRARPKIVRIACPWLIRRFVDPAARFLYVPPSAVKATAHRFGATPFDVDGVQWSDRGERCTFDVMLSELGLETAVLSRLALI